MPKKITSKIVGYKVLSNEEKPVDLEPANIEFMHEGVKRDDVLLGSTYKIKTPQSEHALYVTINDIVLNADTEHEERRPYEIFVNSKNMENFQWVLAMTRLISAVFRKGGEIAFIADELKSVFDPKGGYFKKGSYMPSLVAEIGEVISTHFKSIGKDQDEEMDAHQKQFLADKRKEFEAKNGGEAAGEFPDKATLCSKCNTKAVIMMDGCQVCLNCSDSKCG